MVVLGGGVSGLMAATVLTRAGVGVVVLDKGRRAGGRLASRRVGDATFDHGAQGFEMDRRNVTGALSGVEASGAMVEWGDVGPCEAGRAWFRGQPSMSAVGRGMADGLDVRLATEVVGVHGREGRWIAVTKAGPGIEGSAMVVTVPVPQALAVMQAGRVGIEAGLRMRLEAIAYERCLAVMALTEGPSRVASSSGLVTGSGSIARITDNVRKGISAAPSVTVHSTHGFAMGHWDGDRVESGRRLIDEASGFLGVGVRAMEVHGWRYSHAVTRDRCRCVVASESPLLVMAGDGFGAGGVEGAVLSGIAAAEAVLARR